MTDFLLELRSEEIPARMQAGARADLEKLFRKELGAAGVTLGAITVWSTPRRLALIARDLPLATAAVSEERKGPRADASEQAIAGFKRGLPDAARIESREDAKGAKVLFAVIEKPGLATDAVLMTAIHNILRSFPWPKSMRWGASSKSMESLRWVRPLQGIIAIFGDRPIICEYEGVQSGVATCGHRFHCPGEITIGSAADYQAKLRACHVIVDHVERQDLIRERAIAVAHAAGLLLVEDEGLVVENAGLTEWPVPLLGRFDEAFLEVPPEVIQLTARTNQKYFVCEQDGKLANAFVCTANIVATDGGAAIVDGNRKVLAARLSDARFFWEQDLKVPLDEQAKKLSQISFHEKLGTVADKVARLGRFAHRLLLIRAVRDIEIEAKIASGNAITAKMAIQTDLSLLGDRAIEAAQLAKADLVTNLVGEFPELQGIAGRRIAENFGVHHGIACAIEEHYRPAAQGDIVPEAPLSVALGLADRLDTIFAFFLFGMEPTGSKDPFALRRAAIGSIALILGNDVRCSLTDLWRSWIVTSGPRFADEEAGQLGRVITFFADRLKVQQREAGVRHDLIDAVFALGGEDDLVRLLARVHALQAFVGTEDGANLLAGYKRAANILKKENYQDPFVSSAVETPVRGISTSLDASGVGGAGLAYPPEPAEAALMAALDGAEPLAASAIAAEDFGAAMAALASLRAPIDAFFDSVTVNDADPAKRAARLGLLARLRAAVHQVADFSRIEG